MNCVAIWCEKATPPPSPGDGETSLEVHFNLWKLKCSDSDAFKHFLDIGIMIGTSVDASHVKVYLPFKLSGDSIEDLGQRFRQHNGLVSAVFNEDCQVTTHPPEKVLTVTPQNLEAFRIYFLDKATDLTIREEFDGSTFAINLPPAYRDRKLYFRLRISLGKADTFAHVYNPANSIVESAFSATELVDFRLSETRNLNQSLLEEMRRHNRTKFSKVHFFLMREAHYDYVFSNVPLAGSRQLETDLWKPYVPSDCQIDKVIAYHWKQKEVGDFSAFAKYKFETNNWKTIAKFLLVLLLLSILAGFVGSIIANWVTG